MRRQSEPVTFIGTLHMAWTWLRWRLIVMMGLNVTAALVESVGILLFLPFLSKLGIATSDAEAPGILSGVFHTVGAGWPMMAGLALLVGIFLLKGLLVFGIQLYRATVLNRLELELREDLVRLFSQLDARYAGRQSTGYYGHLVVRETRAAKTAINALCSLLGSAITAGVLVAAALILDPGLSLFVLVSSGASLLLLRTLSKWVRRHSRAITRLEARLSGFMIEALQSFPYLKATQRFEVLDQRLVETSRRTRRKRNRLDRVRAMHRAIQEPVLVVLVAVMFYGSIRWLGRAVSTVLVSLALFYRCMIEMRLLQNLWQEVSVNAGGLGAVWQALNDLRENREEISGTAAPPREISIRLDQVDFRYEEEPVLRGLSLTIPANRITALVGSSGAGKTTLIKLLTGLLKPDAGTVQVGDASLDSLDLAAYRRLVGYVPQEPVVFSGTVFENITLSPGDPWTGSQEEVELAARRAHCHTFISQMPEGYETRLYERGNTLSGGQRQRLAIARELFRGPRLLILDEASSALDSGSEKHIQESLEALKGSVTIVLISHRLSTIRKVDVIHVLDKGRVVASGSFEELMTRSPLFRSMCEDQNLV